MRSILSSLALVAATLVSSTSAQDDPTYNPETATDGQSVSGSRDGLHVKTPVEIGCFSAPGSMVDMGVYTYQTPGWCQPLCIRLAKPIFALVNGTNCFCGDKAPDSQYKVDSKYCTSLSAGAQSCGGFNQSTCGGTNYWDVSDDEYRIGDPTGSQQITIPKQTYTWSGAAAATSSSSSTTPSVVITTSVVQSTPTSTPTAQSSGSGVNKAAVAGGVVVAVVAVAAIIGGIFFYMRRSKQRALAEEQRRHEMMTNFVTAEKPGTGYRSPDSRLDPSLMFTRRMSDGSIRDNEDYSRRILKVANPDS